MTDDTIISTLVSVIVSSLVTWFFAKRYYEKASQGLTAEAEKLRRLNVLMLRALESAGITEFSRDSHGNFAGIKHDSAGAIVGPGASLSATVEDHGKK